MTIKGRPVDGVIFEIWEGHPDGHPFEECFPVGTQAQFVDVPDGTLQGAIWDGNTWVNPPTLSSDAVLDGRTWVSPSAAQKT